MYQENVTWVKSRCMLLLLLFKYWGMNSFPESKYGGGGRVLHVQ